MPRKITSQLRNGIVLTTLLLTGCATTEKPFVPPVFPPPPEEARFIYERTIRSSADISDVSTADRLKLFATGTSDSASGLAKPYGVVVREGRIYVSDTMQRAVMLFDVPRGSHKLIGTEGDGTLLKPLGMAIAPNGDMYISDNTAKRVAVFDRDGNYLRALGGSSVLKRPSGLALNPDATRLYVIDTGGIDSDEHRLYSFDTNSGELLQTIGQRGTGESEFNFPVQVATAPDGTIYVVDGGNFRIQAFKPDGSFKLAFGAPGRRTGQFARPKGIAVDKNGNVYVADAAFGNFQIFNDKGELLLFVGDRGNTGGPAEFMLPAGIAVDEDGRVYMVDQFFRKLEVFRPAQMTAEDGYLGTRFRDKTKSEMKSKR